MPKSKIFENEFINNLIEEKKIQVFCISVVNSASDYGKESYVNVYSSKKECLNKSYSDYCDKWKNYIDCEIFKEKDGLYVDDNGNSMLSKVEFFKTLQNDGYTYIQLPDYHIQFEYSERELDLSKQLSKDIELTEKDFIFDEELYGCQDENREEIDGYLWAMDSLVDRLMDEINREKSPEEAASIIESMNNINFFPLYNVRTGHVEINGSYYYSESDQFLEKQNVFILPLSNKEKEILKIVMETYCQKEYKKSCLEFVNEGRAEENLAPIVLVEEKSHDFSDLLEELNLSVYTFKQLRNAGFSTISEIVKMTEADLYGIKNIGRLQVEEIKEQIFQYQAKKEKPNFNELIESAAARTGNSVSSAKETFDLEK